MDVAEPAGPPGPWEPSSVPEPTGAGAHRRDPRDEEAFTRLEEAMRAACELLEDQKTIERWIGVGFWCWTAVIPELTEHPRFEPPDATYLRRCLARLRDLGSWFFNGTSPYAADHVWEPVPPAHV